MKHYLIEEQFMHQGYPCVIIFTTLGHRCGYVGVPRNHPAYGKNDDEIDVGVHGGLTYCRDDQDGYPVAGQDCWWFGFDCAHGGDGQDLKRAREIFQDPALDMLIALQAKSTFRESLPVRSQEYVKTECRSLATQLKDMEKAPGGGR